MQCSLLIRSAQFGDFRIARHLQSCRSSWVKYYLLYHQPSQDNISYNLLPTVTNQFQYLFNDNQCIDTRQVAQHDRIQHAQQHRQVEELFTVRSHYSDDDRVILTIHLLLNGNAYKILTAPSKQLFLDEVMKSTQEDATACNHVEFCHAVPPVLYCIVLTIH